MGQGIKYDPTITVFKDLFSTDVPYRTPLSEVIERIRVGKSKDTVQKIRKITDKDKRNELKKTLPAIIFGGVFTERNRSGLKKHSGLMVLDFDNYPSKTVKDEHFEKLKENRHFIAIFTSPSGNGHKAVVRVPRDLDKDSHSGYFKAFQRKFDYEYFDKSTSDVSRVCFESYDPDIYVNPDAEVFEAELIDEGYTIADRVPMIPVTNEDLIISKIEKWEWQSRYVKGERNNHIFNIAGAFCEFGVSERSAINYIERHVITDDFPTTELHNTVKSAYRMRQPNSKYFEDYTRIDRIRSDMKNGKHKVMSSHSIDEETYERIKDTYESEDFWFFETTKKKTEVKIDSLRFQEFLEGKGFRRYYPKDCNNATFVRVMSNKVSETSVERIKDFVLDYLKNERKELAVLRKCQQYTALFSENYLSMLSEVEIHQVRDKKDTCFFAYNNGILKVTKDKIEMTSYIDADGYVWESQIIGRDYHVDNTETKNDFKEFIGNISDGEPLPFEVVIGYLLSTYKNRMNNKAIILNDEVITENPEGGTGKGLFVQGLQQIRAVSILDGKEHDAGKSFAYQTVREDCNILVFDDVKKNFSFEHKFSLVTEGLTIERKNKDAIKLPVERSPKIIISTNYAIKGTGKSHERRRHEMELSQYYNNTRSPEEEFGRELFAGWDDKEFMRFDTYMMRCVQAYLTHGLIKQNARNIKLRKLIRETAMEFIEWVGDSENVGRNIMLGKGEYYDNFVSDYPDFKRWLTRKRFNIWMQLYCEHEGYEFKQGNTNGMRWFRIDTKDKKIELAKAEIDDVPF